MKTMRKRVLVPVILLLSLLLGGFWYIMDDYPSEEAANDYLQGNETVTVSDIPEGLFLDGPGEGHAVIFYPGAKVEYTAYLPLLFQLAERGVDCFLVKMPCNLAFLGQDRAADILKRREYEHWYLAGHSLGGAMAASYVSKHQTEFDGLILLAAYPTRQLSGDAFVVLSVYGSEDGILNREKVEEGRQYMPEHYTEICIDGGNHAGFGNYGEQKGDGRAGIPREEQQKQTTDAILRMILSPSQ